MAQPDLNLLNQTVFQKSAPFNAFLLWSMTIGRVIIVATELIVLAVFLARFKLDRDLLDLSNSIKVKVEVLAVNESFEKDFRHIQDRLEMIRGLYDQKGCLSGLVRSVVEHVPQEIQLDDLAIRAGEADFSAKAPSATAFAKLIQELKKVEEIKEITLSSGSFDPRLSAYVFSISFSFSE